MMMMMEGVIILYKELYLTFRAPNHSAKVNQNRIKIAAVGVFTDRLID